MAQVREGKIPIPVFQIPVLGTQPLPFSQTVYRMLNFQDFPIFIALLTGKILVFPNFLIKKVKEKYFNFYQPYMVCIKAYMCFFSYCQASFMSSFNKIGML